jgi:hypothetical protein
MNAKFNFGKGPISKTYLLLQNFDVKQIFVNLFFFEKVTKVEKHVKVEKSKIFASWLNTLT